MFIVSVLVTSLTITHSYNCHLFFSSAPLSPAVSIGVGVAFGVLILVVLVVVGLYLLTLLYRRLTRAGKHRPAAEEARKGHRKRKT